MTFLKDSKFQSLIFSVAMTLLLAVPSYAASTKSKSAAKTLTEQLREKAEASKAKTPAEKRKIMESAIEKLRNSHLLNNALKKGSIIPHFQLPDAIGKPIDSNVLLKQGPLIIVFYRGGWCPYCNLQLHDLQKHLPKIQSNGGQLVAISPETPNNSLSTVQKGELKFHVLSDAGNQTARKFGLVYKLPENLVQLYREFGIDLQKSNGSDSNELPVSATYIADQMGKIVYAHLDADYKKRAETLDLIKTLETLKRNKK